MPLLRWNDFRAYLYLHGIIIDFNSFSLYTGCKSHGGGGLDQDNNQEEKTDKRLKEFWGQFQLFPSSLGNYIFNRKWPVFALAILPYFLYLSTGLIADSIENTGRYYWTKMALREWQEITVVIALITISIAYLRWQMQVPEFFQWLYQTRRLVSSGPDFETDYLSFLQDYQMQLHGGLKRHSFLILMIFLTLVANLVVGIPQGIYSLSQSGTFHDTVYAIVFSLSGYLVSFYGPGLWGLQPGRHS